MDRNLLLAVGVILGALSLSARRAWIEIAAIRLAVLAYYVALRKESVDRNIFSLLLALIALKSLSARRAWIEMAALQFVPLADPVALRKESVDRNSRGMNIILCITVVALRKESVDRNIMTTTTCTVLRSRSPQGERG